METSSQLHERTEYKWTSELLEKKLHISIVNILKYGRPVKLRNRMKDIIKSRKDDQFDRKTLREFMHKLERVGKRLVQEQAFTVRVV